MKFVVQNGDSLKAIMSGAAATTNPTVRVDSGSSGNEATDYVALNGATAVTLFTGVERGPAFVTGLSVYNDDTAAVTVTFSHVVGGATYPVAKQTLAVGDTLTVGPDGLKVTDVNGQLKLGSVANVLDLADDTDAVFGTDDDVLFRFSTADASNPAFAIGLDNTSQQLHITDKGAIATDWNLSAGTHPTVYIHSNTTPVTDYLETGGHNGTTAHVNVAGGTTYEVQIDGTAAISVTAAGLTLPAGQNVIFVGTTGQNEIEVTDNLADALSIKVTGGSDLITFDTSTGALVVATGASVRFNVAGDAQIGSATTDLVAFHGSTPTDQCAAYTQTFSTADRTHAARTATALTVTDGAGTNDGTIGAITADASVIAAVQELAAAINALIVDLADTAGVVNAVVDDLQEKGLAG